MIRSVLAAEFYDFADAFCHVFVIKEVLPYLHGRQLPICMYTDPNSLFYVVVKESTTTDDRLSIDLRAVTESYQ